MRRLDGDEDLEALRLSFWYGSRSNLDFKYFKDLSDSEFSDFVGDLLTALSSTMNDGDASRLIDVTYTWQRKAYAGHLGDPSAFPHAHSDTPIAEMVTPLNQARIALVTSSGHFVEGDDPEPFGVKDMTQADAEARIVDFLAAPPTLSQIPSHVDPSRLRVRHGGYPVDAVRQDHQVALPLGHLRALVEDATIGELAPNAYSFVGATSQVRLKKTTAPQWAEQLRDEGVDAVLLVPV